MCFYERNNFKNNVCASFATVNQNISQNILIQNMKYFLLYRDGRSEFCIFLVCTFYIKTLYVKTCLRRKVVFFSDSLQLSLKQSEMSFIL